MQLFYIIMELIVFCLAEITVNS